MKNFDVARQARSIRSRDERSFTLGGLEFVRHTAIPAEVMVDLDEISGGTSAGRVLEIVSGVIADMCEPPAAEQWAALRARKAGADPLTLGDVIAVVQWLIAEETEIPTSEPSPSGDGSLTPAPGDGSTATSHSEASIHAISPVEGFSVQATPGS